MTAISDIEFSPGTVITSAWLNCWTGMDAFDY